jgi:hypothetical protein
MRQSIRKRPSKAALSARLGTPFTAEWDLQQNASQSQEIRDWPRNSCSEHGFLLMQVVENAIDRPGRLVVSELSLDGLK